MRTAVHAAGDIFQAGTARQPEIQGLRAIAVLAVIWSHARLPGLPGGFTGVDVFFVISGFLITRLLLREVDRDGRIDLVAFWARRARRLLPNAYAALLGTLLLALLLLPGYDPRQLADDITFAALEIVNFRFAGKAVDYFQSELPPSPVLHFWSLSVEEQFYIVWPLLLAGLCWLSQAQHLRSALLLLGLVWCASFAASLAVTFTEQSTAYFSTGTRAWQLATGALLAAGWRSIERLPRSLRAVMAWGGLAAISAGMVIIDDGARYPGVWALLPALGTAALIAGFEAAKPQGALRWGLSAPPMQWIGERSYSWYLWHWPLLALPRTIWPDSPYIAAAAIPASLVIAAITYSWLESPVRHSRTLARFPRATLAGAVAGLGMIIAAGYAYLPALAIVDPRLAAAWSQIEAATEPSQVYRDKCLIDRNRTDLAQCLYGDPSGSRRAVLFGDSHAAHWFDPLHAAARQTGWQLQVWTKSACPPAEVTLHASERPYAACDRWREAVIERLTGPDRPDLIVLSSAAYKASIYDRQTGAGLSREEGERAWRAGLRSTLARLVAAGLRVAIIQTIPRAEEDYRTCLLQGGHCARPRDAALAEPAVDEGIAREFGDRVTILDFSDHLCDRATCPITRNGQLIYRDSTHLSAPFAATFAPHMASLLRSAGGDSED